MDLIREEKNKNIFLDSLNQAVSHKLDKVIFTRKPVRKELMQYTHPLFRVMLVISGNHTYNILGQNEVENIILTPGNALFCQRRGMTGVPDCEKGITGEMLTLVFFPEYIRFLISKRQHDDEDWEHLWCHSSHTVSQAGVHVLNALDELVLANDTEIKACLLTKTLLYICRDNLIDDSPQNISKSFRTYQNIKAYLHENANKNINRESIAKVFKLNPSHISKLFAVHDEHNFNYVLKTLRLEHAVELLKDTTLSIDEITEQCGFVNTSYFIKTFRLFYGRSPGAFRQSKK